MKFRFKMKKTRAMEKKERKKEDSEVRRARGD
jgi:hypothetical protein